MWKSGTTTMLQSVGAPDSAVRVVFSAWEIMFMCVSSTPFGAEVVPEV